MKSNKLAVPKHEAGDHLVRVNAFLLAVDDPGFDQLHHAVGEHLGVDAEVLVVAQQAEHGLGDAADAGLHAWRRRESGSATWRAMARCRLVISGRADIRAAGARSR